MRRQRGFTLLEMLLSVSIISILVGISGPVYNSFVVRNDLDITGQQIVQSLRRAQTYARSMNGDSAWSVEIQTSAATLFKGTNFGGRDVTLDEAIAIPASITRSGLTEVQFAKFTGLPNTTGTITLTSNTNETRTITINAKGMVNY
jgi:prepilin-type N-terminal cleavage/methylation domain-containing protein